ncbi:MAG: MmcQ/YjbR family DNA-binding protein [Candidatus Marinimicrobia bacterium]|nr:MmcQ/YjbR family DNA-binding protein [Candidatus Neomarinimicrobiota bacterium]
MTELSELKSNLLAFAGVTEEYPWGPSPMVIKVGGKMFAIVGLEANPLKISLKADPEDAIIQRNMYDAVQPGYHLNKEHWNTVTLDGSIPTDLIKQMLEESYNLVIKKLSNKSREDIGINK